MDREKEREIERERDRQRQRQRETEIGTNTAFLNCFFMTELIAQLKKTSLKSFRKSFYLGSL